MNLFVRIVSIVVGALFVVSGFVKAVDPLGFSYKLEEYYEVFAHQTANIGFVSAFFEWLKTWALYQSMFFVVLEMVLGVMLIFAIRMQLTAWLMLLLILFFTWLTGYSAITGKVKECGCFGDALPLTAWASFYKDIILTIAILLIFVFRKKLTALVKPFFGNAIMIAAIAGFGYLTIYCYRHLPIIDFRPYAASEDIRENMKLKPGQHPDHLESVLTYKDVLSGNQGDYIMVTADTDQQWLKKKGLQALPWQDSVWMANHEFVENKTVLVKKGDIPKITDFSIWDNDNNDRTALVLDNPEFHFWCVAYDIACSNRKSFERINALAASCEQNKIQFVGLTATAYDQLDPIRHELNAAFPFYYADGTVLKTVIRSNPGIVLLKGSKVIDMWHFNDTPSFEKVKAKYLQ